MKINVLSGMLLDHRDHKSSMIIRERVFCNAILIKCITYFFEFMILQVWFSVIFWSDSEEQLQIIFVYNTHSVEAFALVFTSLSVIFSFSVFSKTTSGFTTSLTGGTFTSNSEDSLSGSVKSTSISSECILESTELVSEIISSCVSKTSLVARSS